MSWAFAERQVKKPVPGYRGTITISAAVDSVNSIKQALQAAVAGAPIPASTFSILPLISGAITAVYPAFNYSGLSDRVWDRLNNVLRPLEVCLPTSMLSTAEFTVADYTEHADWVNSTEAKEWTERTAVSRKEFAGPLSVIFGELDIAPLESIHAAVDDTCALAVNKDKSLEYLELGAMVS